MLQAWRKRHPHLAELLLGVPLWTLLVAAILLLGPPLESLARWLGQRSGLALLRLAGRLALVVVVTLPVTALIRGLRLLRQERLAREAAQCQREKQPGGQEIPHYD